MKSRNLRL